jgi:ADP-ribose pyrophosphatase
MKKLFFLALFSSLSLCASLDQYFSYLQQLKQPNGDFREGEIEIIIDPAQITHVQKLQENRLLKKGFSTADAAEFSRVGVVNEDQYWIWLRDAVYFPKGVAGTYDRLLWKNTLGGKRAGIAILPVLSSGEVILVLNYRHATRSWELELPRGILEPGETQEEGAQRELKEETGLVASCLNFLGEVATDTGVHSSVVPVFLGQIAVEETSNPEYSEAIAGMVRFTKKELHEGLTRGFLEVSVNGKKKPVPLRDAFLTFALLQAQVRGLF